MPHCRKSHVAAPTIKTEEVACEKKSTVLRIRRENVIIIDPFLDQSVCYHCPVYFVLSYHKAPTPISTRHIWIYDRGNYQSFACDLHETNWEILKDNDIDAYSKKHYRSNHCTSKTAHSKQNNLNTPIRSPLVNM